MSWECLQCKKVYFSSDKLICGPCAKELSEKQSPPAPERYTGREIDHVILGYEDRIESKIIRQLQRDLEECLPLLENYQGILSDSIQEAKDLNDSGPNENLVNEFNAVKALIQKLGAK